MTAAFGSPRLTARGLGVSRPGGPLCALADLSVGAGECVALVGPSGAGKSSVLMAVAGVLRPRSGRIEVSGVDPWSLTPARRDRFRGRNVGMVFQSFHMIDVLSVEANLAMAARCAAMEADRNHVRAVLEALGIAALRHRLVGALSQGQVQRAAVARALVNKPGLVLADEPSASLDDGNAAALIALLRDAARRFGMGLLVATHDRRLCDAMDRIVIMGEPS